MLTVESGDVEAARELALSRIGTRNPQRPLTYERCRHSYRLAVACVSRCLSYRLLAVTLSGRSAATPLRDQMQSLRQSEALPLRSFRCVQVTHVPYATLPLPPFCD